MPAQLRRDPLVEAVTIEGSSFSSRMSLHRLPYPSHLRHYRKRSRRGENSSMKGKKLTIPSHHVRRASGIFHEFTPCPNSTEISFQTSPYHLPDPSFGQSSWLEQKSIGFLAETRAEFRSGENLDASTRYIR